MVLYRRERANLPDSPMPEDYAAFDAAVEVKILNVMSDARLRGVYKDEFWRLRRERSGFRTPRAVPKAAPVMPRSLDGPALLAALLYHPELFPEFGEVVGERDMVSLEMNHCRDLIFAWMSNSSDDEDLRRQAESLIDQCEELHTFILTDAVFTAAPFVLPQSPVDEVRSGIRSILVDDQILCVKNEVTRLMGMLDGSDQDDRIRSQVSALLGSIRDNKI